LGYQVTSFTSKGFFDKLGYVEPAPEDNSKLKIILAVSIPLGTILIITLITLYCCWKKKNKKTMHVD
jgi:phosphotransferase system  glucose/maltose/N-acetylglucosamine-specific IIC component